MKKDIVHIADRAEELLSGCDCEFAEIRLNKSTGTSIVISGEQTDSLSSGEAVSGSARTLKDGSWGFVSFNTIEELEAHFNRAREIALQVGGDEPSRVVSRPPVRMSFSTDVSRDIREVPFEEKFSLITAYNDILKSSDKIQTTRAIYRDSHGEFIYLNSEGSRISYDRTYCGVALSSIARDGSVIQPFNDSISGYRGFEIAGGLEDKAESVVKTAVDLLKAESVPGGTYRVITDQKLAGVFVHEAFGHLSEADFVHENEQMQKLMVLGRQYGPEELNIIDYGAMPECSGYIPFDDEGVLPEKTYLIRKGVLSGRLHSRETAMKMDEKVTGNARAIAVTRQPIVRMTNTYIENGPFSPDEIFNDMDNGIYAVDVIGGQTNLEMFTFTAGYGYEIKNGKKKKMYRDIVLSGNVFRTLKNIAMIGNDRKMFGGLGGCGKGGQSPLPVSFGGPHMLINEVLIGGSQ